MRLEGIPWTRYCVKFAEMLEKGLVSEPEHAFMDESESDDDAEDIDEEQKDFDDSDVFFYGYDDEEDEEDDILS
jgi:hypothetical protein